MGLEVATSQVIGSKLNGGGGGADLGGSVNGANQKGAQLSIIRIV